MHTNEKKLLEALGLYFCGILGPAAVQDCTEFPRLMTNALLQLVRDIINGVCYQQCCQMLVEKTAQCPHKTSPKPAPKTPN